MLGEHVGEVAVVQLHGARRLTGHVADELRDAGVAVDGDQTALGAELRGHGLGVPAGPERAVDGHLAPRRPEQLEQLVEEDRGVGEGHLVLIKSHAQLR